jgi:hypothetical protein
LHIGIRFSRKFKSVFTHLGDFADNHKMREKQDEPNELVNRHNPILKAEHLDCVDN